MPARCGYDGSTLPSPKIALSISNASWKLNLLDHCTLELHKSTAPTNWKQSCSRVQKWPGFFIGHTVYIHMYRVCKKSDTLLVSEFSTLGRCSIFLQFLFTYTSFSLNAWYQSRVSSVQMDSLAGWCTITHCQKHGKLPQRGECFIHRASDVASKQPSFKPCWLCCLGCSSAASLA